MSDLISREAAKAAIRSLQHEYDHIGGEGEAWYSGCLDAIQLALNALDALPAADAGEGE